MLLALIIVSLITIILLIRHILYRRQIKDICRQLSFIINNETNIGITTYVNNKEINRLVEIFAEYNENAKKDKIIYRKKDRTLREALANISHDIRTPLTSINGYFQLFSVEEDIQKRNEYEKIIRERICTLEELLEELFSFTKLQNESYEIDVTEYNFTKGILDTLFSFYDVISSKGPEININDTPMIIYGNESAIKRVISNIIKNALVHGSGRLIINYDEHNFFDENVGAEIKHACFCCTNSVEHPENIDVLQVFERFYKADKARSKQSTGLGLAIAKVAVEKMGGKISAQLEDDMFSIKVSFPIIK